MTRRYVISPELLTEADLDELLLTGQQTVWREGDRWRLCQYASAHEAAVLLQQGWELFEDGDER